MNQYCLKGELLHAIVTLPHYHPFEAHLHLEFLNFLTNFLTNFLATFQANLKALVLIFHANEGLSEDFRANGLSLSVAGLPGDAFADFDALTASDYKGRRARFVIAIMDEKFQTVVHAIERHFFIDTLDYALDPDLGGIITVGLEVETRRASRSRVRRYTPQDQTKEFAGDKAFEFVPYINSGVDVKWGKGGSFFPPVS